MLHCSIKVTQVKLPMALFNRSHVISYERCILIMSLPCAITEKLPLDSGVSTYVTANDLGKSFGLNTPVKIIAHK